MRDEVVLQGIVLAMSLVGEYDRRLVILTKERGRITAFARGVRKSNNQLVSKTQLFVMGEFTLYEGRDAYTLKSVEAKEYFHELTYDMEKYCYGSYFCEVMSYFTREGERSTDYLNLLFVSLNALKKAMISPKLIRVIFEIKMLDVFGQGIQSYHCPVCGNEPSGIFSAEAGGLVCIHCAGRTMHNIAVSDACVYTLKYINGQKFGTLYNFTVKDEVLEELENITARFYDVHIGKKFNSLEVIETLT
ncbi:DNA repair protein RecO [Coprococcus sp. OM04-5BH]|uniref:DNA repair protein RecO n=1 Tax=Coprococcus sp. OM04-5BH TaxID=2293093 RepID=UPI000E489C66|nr:DNA repair protein RecO [Coprococcus sp. OM04-5BH]RHV30293.1 DNA repair protein RecO [Coprococcus sp. OM04-5BH]